MTEFEILEIKKKWDAGVPIGQIVRTMPYKKSTSMQYIWQLQRDGVIAKRARKRGRDLVVEAYKNGMHNPYELAETYGYTHKTVQTYLSDARLDRPKHENGKNWAKKPYEKRTNEILKCLESGMGISETARRFCVSKQWVFAIKKRSEKENG